MADQTYHKMIQNGLWRAQVNLLDNPVYALLYTSAYTPDVSITGDEFLSDVPSGAQIASALLTGKTLTDGVFDALDTVFPAPPAGHVIAGIAIYQGAVGSPPTILPRLIRKIDSAAGLGLTTDGAQITIVWPDDANKIFNTHDL